MDSQKRKQWTLVAANVVIAVASLIVYACIGSAFRPATAELMGAVVIIAGVVASIAATSWINARSSSAPE